MFLLKEEDATIPIIFKDSQNKVYHLDWTELLTCDSELPFESFDDVKPGLTLMAPWTDRTGDVQYAVASVVSAGLAIASL